MKVITIVGARPQFVKAATVSRAILKHNSIFPENKIEELIIHTGQHYDANMSDVFFDEMEIPKPAFNLGVGGSSHGAMTGRQLEKIEEVLLKEKPSCVLVYGDTNSTLAGALASVKMHIPVMHVEAGLRSFNMDMPEEINRILTDQVSNVLFCPTKTAINNLEQEGFKQKNCNIYNVGDVMFDAAMFYKERAIKPSQLTEVSGSFVLLTVHRAENTDNVVKLAELIEAINIISKEMNVICPIHPRTKKAIEDAGIKIEARLLEPVSYFEMLWLIENCKLVMTDSGGLQKEAYFFKKPCVTLRAQTEWVELIESGVNQLCNIEKNEIVQKCQDSLNISNELYSSSPLYGDANAASKIVRIIHEFNSLNAG